MTSSVIVREATSEDIDSVMLLVQNCIRAMLSVGIDQWDEVYPTKEVFLSDIQTRTAFIATENEIPVGIIVVNEHQDPEYADVHWEFLGRPAVVHRLTVAPSNEGSGVGRALMDFAEKHAEKLGFDCIRLDAFLGNPRALHFYNQHGYRRSGQVRFRKGLFDCFEKKISR